MAVVIYRPESVQLAQGLRNNEKRRLMLQAIYIKAQL